MEAIIINSGRIISGIIVGLTIGIIASKFFLPAKISKISKYVLKRKKYNDEINEKITNSDSFRSEKTE